MRIRSSSWVRAFVMIPILAAYSTAWSYTNDPCGMVPPIFTGPGTPITRIGLQQTYVFYKDGVETFVIRPGFQGKVDNFGMLIPFPAPPALRKVPDNVFQQIANAVDPPEVVIDLRPQLLAASPLPASAGGGGGGQLKFANQMRKDQVRVLKKEAVGMYEVAVLAAGSSVALKRWMDQNKFVYPSGMDTVCDDYIESNWCFVAVKTKVGNSASVQPVPGQRIINSRLPDGSVFDGNVQGMGFRFKTDRLVVPMRLSAFNSGEQRNVVYLLTDGPQRIRSIPEEYVVRQLKGKTLFDNLTRPLPVRIIGGKLKDVPEWQMQNYARRRDPKPHNGFAAELFAGDLKAVATGRLSLGHEEQAKELLRIGEHFGLRGADYDKRIAAVQSEETERNSRAALNQIKSMTLTVVDGDFPREVLANENLTFADYQMPGERNRREVYDAKINSRPAKQPGIRVSQAQLDRYYQQAHMNVPDRARWLMFPPILAVMGLGCFKRRR